MDCADVWNTFMSCPTGHRWKILSVPTSSPNHQEHPGQNMFPSPSQSNPRLLWYNPILLSISGCLHAGPPPVPHTINGLTASGQLKAFGGWGLPEQHVPTVAVRPRLISLLHKEMHKREAQEPKHGMWQYGLHRPQYVVNRFRNTSEYAEYTNYQEEWTNSKIIPQHTIHVQELCHLLANRPRGTQWTTLPLLSPSLDPCNAFPLARPSQNPKITTAVINYSLSLLPWLYPFEGPWCLVLPCGIKTAPL